MGTAKLFPVALLCITRDTIQLIKVIAHYFYEIYYHHNSICHEFKLVIFN